MEIPPATGPQNAAAPAQNSGASNSIMPNQKTPDWEQAMQQAISLDSAAQPAPAPVPPPALTPGAKNAAPANTVALLNILIPKPRPVAQAAKPENAKRPPKPTTSAAVINLAGAMINAAAQPEVQMPKPATAIAGARATNSQTNRKDTETYKTGLAETKNTEQAAPTAPLPLTAAKTTLFGIKPENIMAEQATTAPPKAGVQARIAADAAARNATARPAGGLAAPLVAPISAPGFQSSLIMTTTMRRARVETTLAPGIITGAALPAGAAGLVTPAPALNTAVAGTGAGPSVATAQHAVHSDGAAIAAAISAMAKSGSINAVLKLSPDNLGHVAVHIGMAPNSLVNVSFIAAVPQTVQILHNNLNDLRQAMAAAGLTLGQASIGSGSSESGGPKTGTPEPESQKNYPATAQTPQPAMAAGVRAVA